MRKIITQIDYTLKNQLWRHQKIVQVQHLKDAEGTVLVKKVQNNLPTCDIILSPSIATLKSNCFFDLKASMCRVLKLERVWTECTH